MGPGRDEARGAGARGARERRSPAPLGPDAAGSAADLSGAERQDWHIQPRAASPAAALSPAFSAASPWRGPCNPQPREEDVG